MTHTLGYKIKLFFRRLKARVRKEQYAETHEPKSWETGNHGNWDNTLVENTLNRIKKEKEKSSQNIHR